ncbi:MAG: methyltransferase type 12 [Nocardioides sp.]|nr:methyltransferase type 12 [Nocardioides sp.]
MTQDRPTFADWDQDATALTERYAEQDPGEVGPGLRQEAHGVAAAYDAVPDGAWGRRGTRSNGSAFTVESLGHHHLHDVAHHAWDVGAAVARATVRAYDRDPQSYGAATSELYGLVRARLETLVAALGAGARVLEIGSAGGRDAAYLEAHGILLRRTDISTGFVAVLRAQGHRAALVDPLVHDLGGPWDGVWANASLLHVARTDLPAVLARLAAATRAGGVLMMSLKQGDGEAWSTHGTVGTPRRFTYWREPALRTVLSDVGWQADEMLTDPGLRGESWLLLRARRRA